MVEGTIVPSAPALPYRLNVWSWSAPKDSAVVNIQAPQSEQATLAKLTNQFTWVRNQMIAAVDWRVSNPLPAPQPPRLFDERGEPLQQFFRVYEDSTDSNLDGIADDVQFANAQDPFDQDIDADDIPNGYDIDLWPAAQFPETNALLSNVLINEVLMSNEFTNSDEDGANDWVELYNPTNAAIDISGWHLSDNSGPGLTPETQRRKWTFPGNAAQPFAAGNTVIASGQFLVVWTSDKNRLVALAPLHTSYELDAGNPDTTPPANQDPVVLSRPNPEGQPAIIVDAYLRVSVDGRPVTANFGAQRTDVSFGRYPSAAGLQTGYMILPTPGTNGTRGPVGQHNVVGALGFTAPPTFAASSDKPGLYENQMVTAVLQPPASGGAIHFTTNSANPTRYSELYSGPLAANRSVIIRAIAAREGYIPSRSITRSYLFKEDILGTAPQGTNPTDYQGARDAQGDFLGLLRGYPEETDAGPELPLLYGMHAATIAAKKSTLLQELSAAPVVSLVATVADFFDLAAGGLYPNSSQTGLDTLDPRQRKWQRFGSFEFIEADKSNFTQANACLLIAGASSTSNGVTRKHSLRVDFDSVHGASELAYRLFPDFAGDIFKSIQLRNPTHDSWSNTVLDDAGALGGEYYRVSQVATYCNEAWVNAAHRAMGHEALRLRWVHLFINGIYWGPHQLTERVDDEFMDAHFGAGSYHVIRQGPDAIDGDVAEWNAAVAACQAVASAAPADKAARYAEVEALIDLDNYIDYLICNTYANNDDWGSNNWRAARRDEDGHKWRFFIWGADWALRPGEQVGAPAGGDAADPIRFFTYPGVTQLHAGLQGYEPYRQRFSNRIRKHLFVDPLDPTSGALAVVSGTDRAVQLFQNAMTAFEPVLFSESARWGYMDEFTNPVPFTKSDPNYLSGKPYGDWDRNTAYRVNVWLPERRVYCLGRMQAAGLYQP